MFNISMYTGCVSLRIKKNNFEGISFLSLFDLRPFSPDEHKTLISIFRKLCTIYIICILEGKRKLVGLLLY